MNGESTNSSPEECIERLNAIELGIRELVATINSGQFADVRLRISQLQTAAGQFKADVLRLPEIKKTAAQQDADYRLYNKKIVAKEACIERILENLEEFLKLDNLKPVKSENSADSGQQ